MADKPVFTSIPAHVATATLMRRKVILPAGDIEIRPVAWQCRCFDCGTEKVFPARADSEVLEWCHTHNCYQQESKS